MWFLKLVSLIVSVELYRDHMGFKFIGGFSMCALSNNFPCVTGYFLKLQYVV